MSALLKGARVFALLGPKLARKLGSDLKCSILERHFSVFLREMMLSLSQPGLGVCFGVGLLGPVSMGRVI